MENSKDHKAAAEARIEFRAWLPNDVARCAGVGDDKDGWREGCDDCMRRTAESTGDMPAWMMPPAIITFWCEFRIEPSNAQGNKPPLRAMINE